MSGKTSQAKLHISNQELATRWDIPLKSVSEVKDIYALNGIYPLTEELLHISTSFDTFLTEVQEISNDYLQKAERRSKQIEKHHQQQDETYMSSAEVTKFLGITKSELDFAKFRGLLKKRVREQFLRTCIESLDPVAFRKELTLEFAKAQAENKNKQQKAEQGFVKDIETRKREIYDHVAVNVRDRNSTPLSTTFYYGPTNSGKTYQALQNLCAEYETDSEGIYVYAGPLRMLAFEVYQKLVDRYGEEEVGFITGEESINPEARLIAVTTEMAPMQGASLVLDEAHWIADENRGDHWTQLLVGGRYDNFHIAAAAEAAETLEILMADSYQIFRNTYTRRTEISYEGGILLEDIPAKTAVVCFTKKMVYAVAKELSVRGHKVGVLYGALPITTRKQQIDMFINGDYDIIVTTDVIGHGINLPIDNVVFAQTEKFDGVQRRELHRWETAQIAGRAGRFGLSEKGRVYVVRGIDWLKPKEQIVYEGTLCAGGKLPADLDIKEAVLAPRLMDLGLGYEDQIWLNYALKVWQEKAVASLEGKNIRPSTLRDPFDNLSYIADYLKYYLNPWESPGSMISVDGKQVYDARKLSYRWEIGIEDLWSLVTGPFDSKIGVIPVIATWLTAPDKEYSTVVRSFFTEIERMKKTDIVDILETSVRKISELKMAGLIFGVDGKIGGLRISLLDNVEKHMVERIGMLLPDNLENTSSGKCIHCGKKIEPQYEKCLKCVNLVAPERKTGVEKPGKFKQNRNFSSSKSRTNKEWRGRVRA